jgi:basic membrane protein A
MTDFRSSPLRLASPAILSRRALLRGAAALGGVAALSALPGAARAQSGLTVGFIYVGPRDDFGYNQSHAAGAAAVKAMEGVTVVEEENVPETQDVQKSMESMINLDGAALLFPTSFGYFDPHILTLAPKYPDVRFQHCGGCGRRTSIPRRWAAISVISGWGSI